MSGRMIHDENGNVQFQPYGQKRMKLFIQYQDQFEQNIDGLCRKYKQC
ncbi:MAG: hypothetical protein CM15mP44_4680 [Candidatus Neomarinimicrobiota bacterium]|nr:MAG: hypothetical protein CM15mP44_4680 [Candidatus Neomarinimicrobiota bacterium]